MVSLLVQSIYYASWDNSNVLCCPKLCRNQLEDAESIRELVDFLLHQVEYVEFV